MPKKDEKKIRVGNRSFPVSNLDKVFFPQSKITKGDLITYYSKISSKMLPLIKDRPLSLHRFPNGIKGDGFFQKNFSEYFPNWLGKVAIPTKGNKKMEMVICNNKATLLYLANQAVVTFHPWLSKKKKLDFPDRMIFDLDPSSKDFSIVIDGAKTLKKILESLHLEPFLMTTGSRGLHVVVPLKPTAEFDEVRSFAKQIAQLMVKEEPSKYTIEQRKNKRGKKVFIDYLRNGYGQTAVAPYSVRTIEGAPIAAPISWKELTAQLHSQKYNIKNIFRRKSCPWSSISQSAAPLKKAHGKLESFFNN